MILQKIPTKCFKNESFDAQNTNNSNIFIGSWISVKWVWYGVTLAGMMPFICSPLTPFVINTYTSVVRNTGPYGGRIGLIDAVISDILNLTYS